MKKLLIILAVIVAVVALIWFGASQYLNSKAMNAGLAPWPNNLGTADDIARHFPKHGDNATAASVVELSKPLGINFEDRGTPANIQPMRAAMTDYLAKTVSKPGDSVDAPPAPVTEWMAQHATHVRALQQQLASNDPPEWALDADALLDTPMPRLIAHMDLFRVLALDALEHHRAGNDAVAWDDLHASWKLSRGLVGRPELISQLIGIAGARLSNGVAAKLSSPAPEWRRELASFDFGGAAVASLAYEGTHGWRFVRQYPAGEPEENRTKNQLQRIAGIVIAPWRNYQAGQSLEIQRQLVTELASLHECDPHPGPRPRTPIDLPNLYEAWRRIGRFRAEVEGVEKLLALKAARAQSGAWPESLSSIEGSKCSDGGWIYKRAADGSMSLSFSKPIPTAQSQTTVVPITFVYGP